MINQEQALELVKMVASKKLRHPFYDLNIELAKTCRMITTDLEQEEIITSLRPSEEVEQKLQRVRIYKSLTKFASKRLSNSVRNVFTVDGIVNKLAHDDTVYQDKINAKTQKFSNGKSLTDYLHDRQMYYEETDPNAFVSIGVEFESDETGRVTDAFIYPIEYKSHQVIHYHKKAGVFEWVITMNTRIGYNYVKNGSLTSKTMQEVEVYDYLFHGKGFQLEMLSHTDDLILSNMYYEWTDYVKNKDGEDTGEVRQKYYFRFIATGTQELNIIEFGKYQNAETDNQTFESFLSIANTLFKDLIITVSEESIAMWQHIFPREFLLVPNCDYKDTQGNECYSGVCGEKQCPKCGGSGIIRHKSGQDIVEVKQVGETQIDLSKMIYVVKPEISVVEELKKKITDILSRISIAVLQEDIFVTDLRINPQNTDANTATQALINKDNRYKVLAPFARHDSYMQKKARKIIADFLRVSENIEALINEYEYPKTATMLSRAELIELYNNAKNAGVPFDVLEEIEIEIIKKTFPDNETKVSKILARLQHKPFSDKNIDEITTILSFRTPDDPQRVLYENFKDIMDEIDAESAIPFSQLDYKAQKALIDAKVASFGLRVKTREATTVVNDTSSFNFAE